MFAKFKRRKIPQNSRSGQRSYDLLNLAARPPRRLLSRGLRSGRSAITSARSVLSILDHLEISSMVR
jgi:hypothetical protein